MTRLDTIALRQRRSIVRDTLFAAAVALASMISLSSLHTAASAARAPSPSAAAATSPGATRPVHLAQR